MGAHRQRYLQDPGWFGRERGERDLKDIAYFSMEFGLGEALPIYSGGLGILARDLGVPVVGIGLLYQQGYIRKISGLDGRQGEAFPYNDPMALPITPAQIREGGWLRIRLELPGRAIFLRVWHARVGKVTLYLLDSNDLRNSPPDCSATVHLYPAKERVRLRQEIFLGIRGWRMLEKPGLYVEICHLKEGHAAFAVLARNFSFMRQSGHPFPVGLRVTGADNVFTPHRPVEAAVDRFSHELIRPYASYLADMVRVPMDDLLALGRKGSKQPGRALQHGLLSHAGEWNRQWSQSSSWRRQPKHFSVTLSQLATGCRGRRCSRHLPGRTPSVGRTSLW